MRHFSTGQADDEDEAEHAPFPVTIPTAALEELVEILTLQRSALWVTAIEKGPRGRLGALYPGSQKASSTFDRLLVAHAVDQRMPHAPTQESPELTFFSALETVTVVEKEADIQILRQLFELVRR